MTTTTTQPETKTETAARWLKCMVVKFSPSMDLHIGEAYCRDRKDGTFDVCTAKGVRKVLSVFTAIEHMSLSRDGAGKPRPATAAEIMDIEAGRAVYA